MTYFFRIFHLPTNWIQILWVLCTVKTHHKWAASWKWRYKETKMKPRMQTLHYANVALDNYSKTFIYQWNFTLCTEPSKKGTNQNLINREFYTSDFSLDSPKNIILFTSKVVQRVLKVIRIWTCFSSWIVFCLRRYTFWVLTMNLPSFFLNAIKGSQPDCHKMFKWLERYLICCQLQ